MPAHPEPGAHRLGHLDERLDPERPAAARVLGLGAHVVRTRHVRPAERDQLQRLATQRLPRTDLCGLRRRQQRLGKRPAGREGRVVGKPLADRGKLEHVERVAVHHAAG